MATKKAGGTAKNLRDSNPKYLGVKKDDQATATPGSIIVRQRGTHYLPGNNVGLGKDHTLFSLVHGVVSFATTRKTSFAGKTKQRKIVHVTPTSQK